MIVFICIEKNGCSISTIRSLVDEARQSLLDYSRGILSDLQTSREIGLK